MCVVSKQSDKVKLLRRAVINTWDEAPMAKRIVIEIIDRTFWDI